MRRVADRIYREFLLSRFEDDLWTNGVRVWFDVSSPFPGMTFDNLRLAQKRGLDDVPYRPKLLDVTYVKGLVSIEVLFFESCIRRETIDYLDQVVKLKFDDVCESLACR